VLTQHRSGWEGEKSPISATRIINWTSPLFLGMNSRLILELNPAYIFFYRRARQWIRHALTRGERFDIVHQINPMALRYPCPAQKLGLKYIVGPLGGSVPTPPALRATTQERHWYRKLRAFDQLRLRYDPMLRRSFSDAALVLGVAPYVQDVLKECGVRRFEVMSETGVEGVVSAPKSSRVMNLPLRLIFVGRIIETKGVLEAIQAVASASKRCAVTFDIIGIGELAGKCEQLATTLGISEIVRFHGKIPHDEVLRRYDESDVLLFPSYREPSGNVVFEAMGRGVPVITSTIGGPGYVVTDACGIRVEPTSRTAFVAGLSDAIVSIAESPAILSEMSKASIERMGEIALWPKKIARMLELYSEILKSSN
jgi:glycosyltransferase involved in cell wall biosynthesis